MTGLLHGHATGKATHDIAALLELATRHGPVVVFVDATNEDLYQAVESLHNAPHLCPIIVIGEDASEPILTLDQRFAFAMVSPEATNRAFLRQFSVCQSFLSTVRTYQAQLAEAEQQRQWQTKSTPRPGQVICGLLQALTGFQSPTELITRFMDWLEQHYDIGQLGVYRRSASGGFDLWMGKRHASLQNAYPSDHALVRYLEQRRQVVHESLSSRQPEALRSLCENVLAECQAQAMIPMVGEGGLLGWLFVGHGSVEELSLDDLRELSMITSCLTIFLERSEVRVADSSSDELNDGLLDRLATAVLMLDEKGCVQWQNSHAKEWFPDRFSKVVSLKDAEPTLFEVILASLADGGRSPHHWKPIDGYGQYAVTSVDAQDAAKKRFLVILRDVTPELVLASSRQPGGLSRSTLSTKIRDPLVAIRAFIDLFPERRLDPAFCEEFIPLVSNSVDRLEHLSASLDRQIGRAGDEPERTPEFALRHLLEDVFLEIGESLDARHVHNTRDVFLRWPPGQRRGLTERLAHLASAEDWIANGLMIEWKDLGQSQEVRLVIRRRVSVAVGRVAGSASSDLARFIEDLGGCLEMNELQSNDTYHITFPKVIV